MKVTGQGYLNLSRGVKAGYGSHRIIPAFYILLFYVTYSLETTHFLVGVGALNN